MEAEAVPTTIIGLVAVLLGAALRAWFEERKEKRAWERLQQKALAEVKNPDPTTTNDPREAMEKALIDDNRKRLRQASGMIRLELNGDHTPKPRAKSEPNGSNGSS